MKIPSKLFPGTFVIGDVHGCLHTLQVLIAELPKDANIILVGDLVDRGNFSKAVVEYVIENGYTCILGNHESLMLDHIENALAGDLTSDWSSIPYFGGYKTIADYRNDRATLQKHLEWMRMLPRYVEIGKFFITHAFALPYYRRRNSPHAYGGLMSNRPSDAEEWGWDWEEGYENYDVINIYGHQVVEEIDTGKNYIGIDTGAFMGRRLSAIGLETMEIVSVPTDARDIA